MANADLNGPISKNQLNDNCFNIRQLKDRAQAYAKDVKDYFEEIKMLKEPDQIEKVTKTMQPIIKAGTEIIDNRIKAETGYTVQEIKYKTVDLYRLMHEIQNGVGDVGEKKKQFDEKIKKLPDELYNAFYLTEIRNTFDKSKIILEQSRDVGTDIIDETVTQLNFIKDNFKVGPALTEITHGMEYGFKINTDAFNSGIDTSKESYTVDSSMETYIHVDDPNENISQETLNDTILKELVKSKQTERGEKVEEFEKKTTSSSNSLIAITGTLFPILDVMKELFTNFLKNKETVRQYTNHRIEILHRDNAARYGLEDTIPVEEVSKAIMKGIKGWKDDEEEETEEEEEDDYNYNPLNDEETMFFYPNAPMSYYSKYSIIYSELDRLDNALDRAQRYCKLNLKYPLESLSTIHDGGKVKNLKHSGNNRYEMIDAIEALNGGKRL